MIHAYKLYGKNIVIDVYSGSVHVVDDVAFEAIKLRENTDRAEASATLKDEFTDLTDADIDDLMNDIDELAQDGKLYARDMFEGMAFDLKARHTEVKALCLHVAHTCNLSCEYCFAAQGRFKGEAALMSLDVGKRAIDFLIENSGNRRNLEVDFFGGEPLMNFEVVKDIVKYARSIEKEHNKNFRFTLTTNGVNIDQAVIDFANEQCHNVVLSLDGRKKTNDRFRVTPSGKGSYDTIVPKFKQLVDARGDRGYYMRGTFTHYNPDFVNDVMHMYELGFTELSMEPVVCAPGDKCALTKDDIDIVLKEYERLGEIMMAEKKKGKGFTFYHYMIDLGHGPCIYKRISGCGAGTEYFAVTPTGELYPCHQFVSDKSFKMGDIWNGIDNLKRLDEFKLTNVYARKECADCWAKLYCSGGCAANAYHATGSIHGVYKQGCELFKKRIECAIAMQAAMEEEEE